MDLNVVLVFIFSVVSLIAELTGSKRRWMVACLALSVYLSGLAVLLGLENLVASPRSKWRRLKKAYREFLWGSDYQHRNGIIRLDEKCMVYCHQGYDTTTYCTHKKHLVWSTNFAPSESSERADLPDEKVRKLQITYHVDQPLLTTTERVKVRRSSKPVAGNKVTYLVDADPDAWGSIRPTEVLKIKRVFKIGELTVAFRFAPNWREGSKATKIAINIRGVLQDLKIYRPTWMFREAWRFISYLAYWESRDCCGVLLTYPYERWGTTYTTKEYAGRDYYNPYFQWPVRQSVVVLNICKVQDLIKLAEGHQLLRIFRTEYNCMAEGGYYWSRGNKKIRHNEGQNLSSNQRNQVASAV